MREKKENKAMALELETQIIGEIGLGHPYGYNYFNGSGSCEYIRQEAARRIGGAIKKHADAGEMIAQPDDGLLALMHEATAWDKDRYTLTKAWEVASYVIAAHIYAAANPENEQAVLREQEQSIRQVYQQFQRPKLYDRYGYSKHGYFFDEED
jgi:hypothetical protein